jgi:predicted secreted hydrolase
VRIYDRQRMPTRGRVTHNGTTQRVRGTTWFEHGWGNWFSVLTVNWDYFHLELNDGRDVMVAQVRRTPLGPVFAKEGVVRDNDGNTTYLHGDDFSIEPLGTWRRDETCAYPGGSRIRLGDDVLVLKPLVANQGTINPIYGSYWDGNMNITGTVTGRGIAEYLNYCQNPVLLTGGG